MKRISLIIILIIICGSLEDLEEEIEIEKFLKKELFKDGKLKTDKKLLK